MTPLRAAVEEYVALRRALGTRLESAAAELRGFASFLEHEGAEFVTTKLALRWACRSSRTQPATRAERLGVLRRFATWRSAVDPRTEVPPAGLLPHRRPRKPPYIYSGEEIARLVAAAGRLRSPRGLRAQTFATLFALVAATGLRPGEALALDDIDVDLRSGVLAVRRAKFGKSRFVPIHDSTRAALERYRALRDRLLPGRVDDAFFVTERGVRISHDTVDYTFAAACWETGLRARPPRGVRGRGPRLHDMRHRFAVTRLVAWYREGADVERELPKLATYLGHAHVRHTYWYIEAVPELLRLATERVAARRDGEVRP